MSFDYCRKVVGYETNELALLRQMDEDGWEFVVALVAIGIGMLSVPISFSKG